MVRACGTQGGEEKCMEILAGSPKERLTRRVWKCYLKTDI